MVLKKFVLSIPGSTICNWHTRSTAYSQVTMIIRYDSLKHFVVWNLKNLFREDLSFRFWKLKYRRQAISRNGLNFVTLTIIQTFLSPFLCKLTSCVYYRFFIYKNFRFFWAITTTWMPITAILPPSFCATSPLTSRWSLFQTSFRMSGPPWSNSTYSF
jgi:hypothetical protein